MIYCHTVHAFAPFTYVCCEKLYVLTGNILVRSMPNGNCQFSSASLSLVGDNSLVYELRVMAAVELYLNATYTWHPALKSVYEKSQICGKLFSSCTTVFELPHWQGLLYSKTSEFSCCLLRHLSRKWHWLYV